VTEIHQVLVSAGSADATTNAALELRDQLRELGPSEIFARHIDPGLIGEVRWLAEFPRASRRPHADLIVYHASIGEPAVFSFLSERPEPLALVYHNITPPEFFVRYDSTFASLLEAGRYEVARLAERTVVAVAASEFNAADLRSMGYRKVEVAPLRVDPARLRAVPADRATESVLASIDGPVLLFVGQVMPHKRHDWLLAAFHALVTYTEPESHLFMVGPARLAPFRQAVELFAAELRLRHARLTGPVSLEELAAYFRRADVFVTASEHEGFCVPLLEAMTFDVPVMARAHAAVPETLGGAGLLLDKEDSPLVAAEAVSAIVGDGSLRQALIDGGRERLSAVEDQGSRHEILGHLSAVI
jgi:glycosyltransferase involved in cell wall biosynthesis